MSDIFISYARATEAEAQRIAEALRALGFGVWRDDEIPAHKAFGRVLEERLAAAKAVLVLWSADAAQSDYVRSEASRARSMGKLVQLTLDKSPLPMPFDQIQCADLKGWTGDAEAAGWRKVVSSVAELTGGAAATPVPGKEAAGDPGPDQPLLAVLPFDNLSGDAEMAYFSDGVSEEILQTVARGTELKVIGRGSSFQFRGADKAAAHVARVIKATHVLDGAVRRSGAKVRISANLIECARETTMWSDRFDRELSDVFVLQDEIATAVAAALKVAFAPAAKAETIHPDAYTLYLKALEIRNRGLDESTLLEVADLLGSATALAPNFARAWAFLATIEAECLDFEQLQQPYAVTRAKVAAAAAAALSLDPCLGAAHQALAQLLPAGRFAEREELHLTAASVAPNDPTALTNASLFFAEVGRVGEALRYAERAYSLDPMYPWVANWRASLVEDYAPGCEKSSGTVWQSLVAQWPDNALIAWGAIISTAAHDNWARFDALVACADERNIDTPMVRGGIAYGVRRRDPSPEARARYLHKARDRLLRTGTLPMGTFSMLYALGLIDDVFDLVDRTSFAFMFDDEQRSPNGAGGGSSIFSPVFAPGLMQDIRFVGLCAKLGLVDYWVKSDCWPDCAEAGVLPYDFKAEARRLLGQPGGERDAP